MQILSLGQIISLAKALKKTIVCSLSPPSLKVTRLWMLIFFISEMVFSEKSDSCPQSQRKDDGNSSTAILHTRINPNQMLPHSMERNRWVWHLPISHSPATYRCDRKG
ncbi:hypothetical protein GXM_09557 [Nostoc sphaeroides CCNUC1]|uniref:Uncharacterized protein n=1 Tax=Nostoc sphaeroides CCNUC1 TaxID=2653204 RepID=A0A5P8WGV3_9NOSO|nr:hypothetical protein GXM_09557 [Nostoc sphaeroides CCNUC1]